MKVLRSPTRETDTTLGDEGGGTYVGIGEPPRVEGRHVIPTRRHGCADLPEHAPGVVIIVQEFE